MAKNKYSAKSFASWQKFIRESGTGELLGNDAMRQVFEVGLSRAGKLLGLDAAKPDDAALMLRILAYELFPNEKKPRGRPKNTKKWGFTKLLQLAADCSEVKWDLPKLSDKKAVDEIKKRHPNRYRDTSAEMMRQMLRAARWEHDEWMFEKHGDVEAPEQDDEGYPVE